MLSGRFSHRAFSTSVIAVSVLGCCAISCGRPPETRAVQFCAIMSESVGLYRGNAVTQMGYKIGTVKTIEARDTDVKIGFTIDAHRPIPRDVKAITRSPSILADRSLELVGNYSGGPKLAPGDCIPLNRSFTPLSISQVVGSTTNFVNEINPDGSTNLKDALQGIDQAFAGNGKKLNELLTTSSALLDNPDQAVADLGEVTRNIAQLTSMLRANRAPLKQVIQDLPNTTSAAAGSLDSSGLTAPLAELVQAADDIELQLGPEIQLLLDETSELLRIFSPHYKGLADMLNFLPRWISGVNGEPPGVTAGGLAKHINNHLFGVLPWRPPLFRVPNPNGRLACGKMNAAMPGSCADVGGRPYAMDVALLQYVLTEAARR